MSKLKFETVIVIGFGKIAQDVASTLLQYDVTLKLLQTEMQPFSTLESFAHSLRHANSSERHSHDPRAAQNPSY